MLLFTLSLVSLLLGVYHRKNLKKRYDKFFQLVRNYRLEEPHTYYVQSLYKSFYLGMKCALVDLYHYLTSVRLKNFIFVKYVHGGKLHMSIIPIVPGPKKELEYAYIDEVRNDAFISSLYGMNKNFSNCPESLLEFGNCIRYKFYDANEIVLRDTGIENEENNKKKSDHLQKIKNLMWTS